MGTKTEATPKRTRTTNSRQRENTFNYEENSKRSYPLVFKFAIIGLLTFDLFIFYYSNINIINTSISVSDLTIGVIINPRLNLLL